MLKTLLFLLLGLMAVHASADIYKCKDSQQRLVYQDTPCAVRTLGRIASAPAPSAADMLQARRDLDRMIEGSRYYDQKQREEWNMRQEQLRLLEAREMREQQAAEESAVYIPAYAPGYPYGRVMHRDHRFPMPVKAAPRPERPCVIGYIGDKRCR